MAANDPSRDTRIGELEARIAELEARNRELEVLGQAHQLAGSLSDVAPDAIFLSRQGICVDANQAASDLYGYTREEFLDRPGTDFIAEQDRDLVREMMAKGESGPYEAIALRKDGSTFPCEIRARMHPHEDPPLRITLLRDLSQHKQDQKRIQESEQLHRTLVESLNEGVIYQEASGRIVTWNATAENVFGLGRKEVVGDTSEGRDWSTIREDGSDYPGAEHPSMFSLRTGEPVSDEIMGIVRPEGTRWIKINTRPLFHTDETLPYAVVISFSDITASRAAQAALAESEQRFRAVFDNAGTGIVLADIERKVVLAANPAFESMLGYGPGELDNLPVAELSPLDDAERSMQGLPGQIKPDIPMRVEKRYYRKDGSVVWGETVGSLVTDVNGKPLYGIASVNDITERKQAQQHLQREKDFIEKVLNASPDSFFLFDPVKGRALRWNQRVESSSGYSPRNSPPSRRLKPSFVSRTKTLWPGPWPKSGIRAKCPLNWACCPRAATSCPWNTMHRCSTPAWKAKPGSSPPAGTLPSASRPRREFTTSRAFLRKIPIRSYAWP